MPNFNIAGLPLVVFAVVCGKVLEQAQSAHGGSARGGRWQTWEAERLECRQEAGLELQVTRNRGDRAPEYNPRYAAGQHRLHRRLRRRRIRAVASATGDCCHGCLLAA